MSNISREHFARRLVSVYDRFDDRDFDLENYNQIIMQAFLDFGSNTPSNDEAFKVIEFGSGKKRENPYINAFGFKLRDKDVFVLDVLNELENSGIPDTVRQKYPDLEAEEWSAILRIATMVVNAFSPLKRRSP